MDDKYYVIEVGNTDTCFGPYKNIVDAELDLVASGTAYFKYDIAKVVRRVVVKDKREQYIETCEEAK